MFCASSRFFQLAAILMACASRIGLAITYQKEADNFNITRQLTVFNTRTDMVLFTMKGNFSKETESDGDVTIVGENLTAANISILFILMGTLHIL